MRNGEFIERFLAAAADIARSIPREPIDQAVELLYRAWADGRTVFLAGNGGSAGTASHFAADLCTMTAVPGQPRLRALSLVDNVALVTALVNDAGWDNVYVEQLRTFFQPGDVLVTLSVHGGRGQDRAGAWSQNLMKAIAYAKAQGGTTIGFAGFDGGAMREACDVCVLVPWDGTPHVEAFHVVLHHLMAFCLAERIAGGAGAVRR